MRKIFRFLKITILTLLWTIIALGLGIYIYFNFFFDLNKYKPMISELVYKQTGRNLQINGNARLGISLVPTLELADVSFENAKWSDKPEMLKLERLDIKVSLLPLLKKNVEINKIVLVKPEIYLEVNKDGVANWDFAVKQAMKSINQQYAQGEIIITDANVIDEKQSFPISSAMVNVLIQDGIVSMKNAQTGKNISLAIKELSISSKSIDDDLSVVFDLVFNGEDIKGTARVGSIKTLLESFEPYPVSVKANAFGVNLVVDGSVINPLGSDIRYVINLDVYNPRDNFGAPRTRLEADIEGTMSNVDVKIRSLDVEGNIIKGEILADISGKIPSVEASLRSELINLPTILPAKKEARFEIPSIISSAHASKMIPETVIPYELLSLADAAVILKIDTLIVNEDVKIDGLSLNANLKDGVLDITPLVLGFNKGKIDINAKVISIEKKISLNVLSHNLIIQEVYKGIDDASSDKFAIVEGGNTDININAIMSGATANQLAESMNGRVVVIVNGSKIKTGKVDMFEGSVLSKTVKNVSNLLKFGNKKPKAQVTLNCAVLRSDIEHGKMIFPNGIAFDTDEFKLSSNGYVNLNDDKLSFNLTPFSGNANDVANITRLLSSFVKISGTIDNPSVGIDETAVQKTAGGVLAGASSLIAPTSTAPCYGALVGTSFSEKFPKPTGGATIDVKKIADDAMKKGGEQAKKSVDNLSKEFLKTGKISDESVKKELDSAKDLLNSFGGGLGKKKK